MKRIQDFKTFSTNENNIFDAGKDLIKKTGNWLKKLLKAQKDGSIPVRDKKYNPETQKFDLKIESTPVVKVHMPEDSGGTTVNFKRGDLKSIMKESLREQKEPAWKTAQKTQDPEIDDVTADELLSDLNYHFKRPETGRPLLIWGAPGIGKTSVVKQFGLEQKKVPVIEVILSLMEPTDVAGLPGTKPDEKYGDTKRSVNYLPMIWPLDNGTKIVDGKEVEGDGGIIFLDEINRAHPSVQAAMLKVVLDREIAGANYKIPSKWLILAAANRPEDEPGAMVKPMSFALANRFAQVNFINDPASYVSYAKRKNLSDDVTAFVELMQDYFYMLPSTLVGGKIGSNGDEAATTMGVTPRSWEASSIEYQDKKEDAEKEGRELSEYEINKIFSKHLGKTVAFVVTDFIETTKIWPISRIEKIYKDPEDPSLVLPLGRGGTTNFKKAYAVCYMISKYKEGKTLDKDEFVNLLKYLTNLDAGEIAMSALNMVKRVHPEVKNYLGDTSLEKIISPFVSKYRSYMKEI